MKTDDDAFINIFVLQRLIGQLSSAGCQRRALVCKILRNTTVYRSGKYEVLTSELAASVFPDYCEGLAYIFTNDVARALYQTSLRVKVFPMEDFYVTNRIVGALDGQVKLTDIISIFCNKEDKPRCSKANATRLLGDHSLWHK